MAKKPKKCSSLPRLPVAAREAHRLAASLNSRMLALCERIEKPKTTRDPDPCAAQQAVRDAAAQIALEAMQFVNAAMLVWMASEAELNRCRTGMP
jgi:hypothetical protein